MDTTPYEIHFTVNDKLCYATVKPCCEEDKVVDYRIYVGEQLAFNIARSNEQDGKWVITLRNADRSFSDSVVQAIGKKIDQHNKV